MSAYTDEKPFSVDLVAAVLRQVPFTDKLYHLGWLNGEFFDTGEYERVSRNCVSRYQGFEGTFIPSRIACSRCTRFLSLMASLPSSFFVPSTDIDFAWQYVVTRTSPPRGFPLT